MAARLTGGLIGPEGRKQLRVAARFASAGFELATAIVVGYFGGRYLDGWLGTENVLSYVGLSLGIIAGFTSLFRLARAAQSEATDRRSDDNDEKTP